MKVRGELEYCVMETVRRECTKKERCCRKEKRNKDLRILSGFSEVFGHTNKSYFNGILGPSTYRNKLTFISIYFPVLLLLTQTLEESFKAKYLV